MIKAKKSVTKKARSSKKVPITKKQKIVKKELKRFKKITPIKQIEEKKRKKLEKEKLFWEQRSNIKEFFRIIGLYRTPEEKRQIALQKERERQEKLRIEEELRKRRELEKQRAQERKKIERERLWRIEKKKIKDFFHDAGLYKTPDEKRKIALQKEREQEKARQEVLKRQKELESKQREKTVELKKTIQIKPIKKEPLKKIRTIKKISKPDIELPELKEDFGLKDMEFELPKELEKPSNASELPDTLEDLDIEDLRKELQPETKKSKEILEAEQEIKSAIEKIKLKERPSFFNRLFARKEKPVEDYSMPAVNEISIIQRNINKARDALSKFDLKTAKTNYIEIMKLYNKIKPEEQAKVYHDIRDLYFERKSAEELKV